MSFELEWEQQKETKVYDFVKLTNLLIEYMATAKKISSESFHALLEIIPHRKFQESDDMYYLISALRDDGNFFSASQLAKLYITMSNEEYNYLSKDNAYGLCDVIVDLFENKQARIILERFQNRINLEDAAVHAKARLER